MPSGVQEARQRPGVPSIEKGVAAAHTVQSFAVAPEHIAQLEWHGTHMSLVVLLPPEHVKPGSTWQVALQPSSATGLASSHVSGPTRRPSPQTATHVSLLLGLPPVHLNPVSIWQVLEQPSPSIVELSSHCSSVDHTMLAPSPQMGLHVSTPPTPLPSVLLDWQ